MDSFPNIWSLDVPGIFKSTPRQHRADQRNGVHDAMVPLRLSLLKHHFLRFFFFWFPVAACRQCRPQSESNTRPLICLLVFLPSSFPFLPYLATNKTKDEARRRRRKVRNHVQLDGYHSSLITLFGACPLDPFWFVAIIGTAAQWSLGHQAATNACRWLAGAVQPRFLQPFIPSWAYPIPMVTKDHRSLSMRFAFLVRSHHWHRGSVEPWPPSSHERMQPGVSAPPLR